MPTIESVKLTLSGSKEVKYVGDATSYDVPGDATNEHTTAITEWEKSNTATTETEPSVTYDRARAAAYPSIGDQLDMLWHAVDTGDWTAAKVKTTEFYTALKAVKDANPK